MTQQRPWIPFLLLLLALVSTDAFVSARLQWDGVFRLVERVEAPGDLAAAAGGDATRGEGVPVASSAPAALDAGAVQVEGIYVLVVMALGMYVFAAWVLARAWATARSRPASLTDDELRAIGASLASIDPSGPAEDADALVAKPIADHARLRGLLSDTTAAPVRAILGRIGPRDLLGHEALDRALAGGVAARWRVSLGLAESVEALGQLCAVAGLGSTVAGLIVAGARLGSADHVFLALSGALLKCMVGMLGRLGCLAASHLVQQGAQVEEQAVLAARGRVA